MSHTNFTNFVAVNEPTNTTRYLTPIIFNKDALSALRNFGFINAFIDDYGAKKRYKDCLFFLFQTNTSEDFVDFEKKISDFKCFYDYYDIYDQQTVNPLRMYLFKIHEIYTRDVFMFKHGHMDYISESLYSVSEKNLDLSKLELRLETEIYRFSPNLSK